MYKIDTQVDKPDIDYLYNQVVNMTKRGIKLCDLTQAYNHYCDATESIKNMIVDSYGIENPNSAQQVARYMELLDDADVYEVGYVNGKWSTKGEILETLSKMGYDFAANILLYRKLKKFSDTIKSLKNAQDSSGCIHPTVSLSKTNRINYSDPALMNIPKTLLWDVVIPRDEDSTLISVDIKNQEPHILLSLLGAKEFTDALTNPAGIYETLYSQAYAPKANLNILVVDGATPAILDNKELAKNPKIPPSIYSTIKPSTRGITFNGEEVIGIDTLNTITHPNGSVELPTEVAIMTDEGNIYTRPVSWEAVPTKKLAKPGIYTIQGYVELDNRCEGVVRSEFKVSWNAMTYGASYRAIASICKHIDGKVFYDYFSKIPEMKAYRKKCKTSASNGVTTVNTLFGTRLYTDIDPYDTKRLERVLMDLPIQGTGSDILSLLVKHFNSEAIHRGLDGQMEIYFSRHDELVLQVKNSYINSKGYDAVETEIRDILEHQINDWVPFKIEVKQLKPKTDLTKLMTEQEESDIFE